MKPKVYVTRRIPESGINMVREYCDVTVRPAEEPAQGDELMRQVSDKDGIICLPGDKIDKAVMEAARLKVISTFSVGFEHIDVKEATKRGIYVGYTPGILTDATADMAFTLLLSMARKIPQCDQFVREGGWKVMGSPLHLFGTSVWGTTLIGIIGLGRIGKAMAERAHGFNMKVLYADSVRLTTEEEKGLGIEYRSLDDLLRESDFVSVHTPLTPDTRHLINAAKLKIMKPSAILINTSRGAVIDEEALVIALQEHWIAGAGLDVFEKEPIDPKNPLLALDNVVIIPHMGSATTQTRSAMSELAARNLLAVLRGTPPPSWLNPEVEKIRPLSEVKMLF